jgi:hypothetical protein
MEGEATRLRMHDFGGALMKFYVRTSHHTCFLIPCVAIGTEEDGRPFLEIAWLCWAIGIGDAP